MLRRRLIHSLAFLFALSCSTDEISAPSAIGVVRHRHAAAIHATGGAGNRLGVNTHGWGRFDNLLDSLAAANAGWVRDLASWTDPWVRDYVIQTAQNAPAHSMHVLGGVNWDVPDSLEVGNGCGLVAPQHLDKWDAFINSVVTEQGLAGVRYFSIGNEPNVLGCGSAWIDYYWPMLTRAAQIVHSKGSAYKVVGFELADDLNTNLADLNTLMASNPGVVDVFGIHMYADADDIVNKMNGAVAEHITAVPEVWLTEFGLHQGTWSLLDERNHLAVILQNWLAPQLITNPKWTKIFVYSFGDAANGELFTCGETSCGAPTYAYYAMRYLQMRALGAATGITYRAFAHNAQPQQWFVSNDGPWVPSTIYLPDGVWGSQVKLAGDLTRAGAQLCLKYHYGFIGWVGGEFCNGEWVGPFYWWGPTPPYTFPLESLRFKIENPLPQADGSAMPVCAATKQKDSSGAYYLRQGCKYDSSWSTDIGDTGLARPVFQFTVWFGGSGY